jgi:uncharacterized glyoxalase superfamily protein PhnB
MGYQPAVSPQLAVRRGREAIEFYKAAFGARELYRVGVEDPYGHHWEIGRPLVEWPPSHRGA